jgi:hypothetical protein
MRIRGLFVVVTVAGLLATLPASAARAGGNWLDIRPVDGAGSSQWSSWSGPFVPGTAVEVRAQVYVQSEHAIGRLRTSGPYYAWIARSGGRVDVRGIPSDATRLSAFVLRWTSRQFAVAHASFVMPALPSGDYTIEVCNDPCTLSGFGDFVQGWTGVVQSTEAAQLKRERDRFRSRFIHARADAAQTRREAERLQADLEDSEGTRATLTARIAVLTDQLDSARRPEPASVTTSRTLVDPWIGVLLAVAALSLAAMIRFRYRARRIVVPDTLEELLVSERLESRTVKR